MDVGLLLMLQAEAPGASITAEVVEGSAALTQTFKGVHCQLIFFSTFPTILSTAFNNSLPPAFCV